MSVYALDDGKLKKLAHHTFERERDLHTLLIQKENLQETLEVRFLESEFDTKKGHRLDTLAIGNDGTPVIIEYKRDKNDRIIQQVTEYLDWLEDKGPEFFEQILDREKITQPDLEEIELDWNNPRVICIAESYNRKDISLAKRVNFRIDLYEYRNYGGKIFSLEPVNQAEIVKQTKNEASKSKQSTLKVVTPEVEEHLKKSSANVQEVFYKLQNNIIELDSKIVEKSTKPYIGYSRLNKNFAEVYCNVDSLRIILRDIVYNDPENIVEKVPANHKWTLRKFVRVKNIEQAKYVFNLIEQSYKDVL